MKKKLIILGALAVFTLVMYLCKDWMVANVPDNNYTDRVVHNKEVFIGIIAIVGFGVLFLFRKKKGE